MTGPAETDPLHSAAGVQIPGQTLEYPNTTPELVEALRHDREVLVREAILWQRWIRYLGFLALLTLAVAFGRERTRMIFPAIGAGVPGGPISAKKPSARGIAGSVSAMVGVFGWFGSR